MIVRVSVLKMVYSKLCKWEWRECVSVERREIMWEGREESVCCVMWMENGYCVVTIVILIVVIVMLVLIVAGMSGKRKGVGGLK